VKSNFDSDRDKSRDKVKSRDKDRSITRTRKYVTRTGENNKNKRLT
jgi:hypothetical protein